MLPRITALMVAMLFMVTTVFAQPVADLTVVDKTAQVEKIIYGTEQTGSLVERINKLEKDVYGAESQEALIKKADRLYTYTKETTETAPSLILRINAIEWTLTHSQTNSNIKLRVDQLEQLLHGAPTPGAIDSRVAKLNKLAFSNNQPEVSTVEVAKDTLVKIKLLSALDTRKSRTGDVVAFQAVEDVYVNDLLVIAKGAPGTGKVTAVEQAKNFGRDAKLEISFETVQAVDGNSLIVFLGEKAKEETRSTAKAAGASVVGMAVLGPIGIVGGAFVHGKEITIPAGAEMFIQTKETVSLYGIKVK